MNFDNAVKNLSSLSFDDVEKYSQECSKQIIYDYVDKGQSFSKDSDYFVKCERILAEYRDRLSQRVKHDSGVDLAQKLVSEEPSK